MKTIGLLNVKGVTGSFDLAPITVVSGSNSTGKTAVLNAVTLALIGYIPAIGKKPGSTFSLSSGERMAVVADGATFSWEMKRLQVVSKTPEGWEPAPETMLDLSGLFSLTKEQRMMAILKACALPPELTAKALVKNIQAVCPLYEMPTITGAILEDIAALTANGKAMLSRNKKLAEEYEGASARHAEEMTNMPVEPDSLQGEIDRVSEAIGAARQKQKAAETGLEERKRILARAEAILVPSMEGILEEEKSVKAELAAMPETPEIDEAPYILNRDEAMRNEAAVASAGSILKQQISSLQGKIECPTCGHHVGPVVIDQMKEKLEALRTEWQIKKAALDYASNELKQARFKTQTLAAKRRDLEKRLSTIQAQKVSIPQLEESRKALMASLDAIPMPADAEAFAKESDGLVAVLNGLQQRQRYHVAYQKLTQAAEAAVEARKECERRQDIVKLALAEITQFRSKLLENVATTLLTTANRIIKPVLGAELRFEEGDFTLGNAVLATLSGSEQMVVYAGLQVALNAAYSPRIVVMDELGRIDADRKRKLLSVINEVIKEGLIDQFIAADPSGTGLEAEYVKVIKIGGGA